MTAKIRALLRGLFHRSRVERELDDELRFHLDALVEANVRAGMAPEEARRQAQLELGRVEQVKEEVRAGRPGVFLETLWQDVRFGARVLRKNPGFTLVAVVTLALGIGATTAVFSVVRSILLRPLPYDQPERLAIVWGTNHHAGQLRDVISGSNFVDLQRRNSTLEGLSAFVVTDLPARESEGTVVVARLEVTPEFLSVLGVRPVLGRTFEPSDAFSKSQHVGILTHGFWNRRFGGDPAIVGKTLSSMGQPHTVVGVLPPEFWFPADIDLITLLSPAALEKEDRTHYHYWALGRLRPGVTFAQAESDLDGVMAVVAQQYPSLRGWEVTVEPLPTTLSEPVRPALLTLLAAAGLVLLIGCSNVANLLLSRGIHRNSEFAVRVALGAARARLVRQLLTEALLLAFLAGGLGALLAKWLVEGSRAILPGAVPVAESAAMVTLPPVHLDAQALFFAVLLSLATVLLSGLFPALRSARVALPAVLNANRAVDVRADRRTRNLLIAAEAAFATVLLVLAGLVLRTADALARTDPGFERGPVLTMLFGAVHPLDAAARARYYTEVLRRVGELPGLSAAALNDYILLQNEDDYEGFHIEGRAPSPPGQNPREEWRRISSGYFRVMGIPLVRGRFFTEGDDATTPSVAIINQVFARKYWPGEDPLGRRIRISNKAYGVTEIVGIVGDVREVGLDQPGKPMFFVPYHRAPRPVMGLFVRAAGDADSLLPPVQRAVWSVDPAQPIFNVNRLDQLVSGWLAVHTMTLWISLMVALLAASLTAVGIFGVVSYATAQRTREIGLRMALGAQGPHVFCIVAWEGLKPAVAGTLVGMVAAVGAARLIESQLYGVRSTDALTLAGAIVFVAAVSFAACWIPARRATRVDPMVALRYE